MHAHKQVFQENGKKRENMRKHYRSQKSFSYEIYAGTSKATHKVFQQRGVSFIAEPFVLHNLQFFAWKLWMKIGCVFTEGCVLKYVYYSMHQFIANLS